MYSDLKIEDPPHGMIRALALTLATAMVWLDHDCRGGCPSQAATLTASVWYARHAAMVGSAEISTIVVVRFDTDFRASTTPDATLLDRVNDCARSDRIQVYERRNANWDDALAVLVNRTKASSPLPSSLQ